MIEAKETGAEALVTTCPFCTENFTRLKADPELGQPLPVMDVLELVNMAV
jgi:Fe-S oxidoreductase